jgi:hypothetical protein
MCSGNDGRGENDPPDTIPDTGHDGQPLDYSPSSGAVDPEHAAQDVSTSAVTGRHAYTENATFTAERMEAESDRWDSLNQANRDWQSDGESNGSRQHAADHVNDTVAWGRRIGLTSTECEHAANLVLDADAGYMNNHGAETVILAALTLAANTAPDSRPEEQKALREESVFSDQTPDLRDAYEELRNDLDVTRGGVKACRTHLRTHL